MICTTASIHIRLQVKAISAYSGNSWPQNLISLSRSIAECWYFYQRHSYKFTRPIRVVILLNRALYRSLSLKKMDIYFELRKMKTQRSVKEIEDCGFFCAKSLSHVRLFVTSWTVARLLCPWGFSRQECWSGLPCLPPGDLPNPGIEHRSPTSQVDSLPSEPPGKPRGLRFTLGHFLGVLLELLFFQS